MLKAIKELNKKERIVFLISLLFLFLFFILPCIIKQGDVVIYTHDHYDSVNAWLQMLKNNGQLFSLNEPTSCFMGMSTMYYGHVNYSFYTFLFYIFDNLTANIVAYCLSILISFFSMFLLLNYIWKDNKIIDILGSVIYASLSCLPFIGIALATIPLFFYLLLVFYNKDIKWYKSLFLFIFPFFSHTMLIGIFLLAIWFVAIFVHRIKEKKWNWNLVIGLFVLIIGFVFVDLKTFYMMFCSHERLNREVYQQNGSFFKSFFNYIFKGVDPAYCWQMPFIIPVILFALIFSAVKKISGKDVFVLRFTTILIVSFALLAAVYDSGLIANIITAIFPFLAGFNFGRFVFLNRVLWNVAFIAALIIMSKSFKHKIIPVIFAVIQLFIVSVLVLPAEPYLMGPRTVIKDVILRPLGLTKRFDLFTYNEFYSEDLFNRVKEDINYNGENVAALGYHPAVLMYNGFNTIDGYLNCYPLEYMEKFRSILEPEFEVNAKDRDYYDAWGGRMYLYNKDVSFYITRDKPEAPVELRINKDIMKNDFKVKYLISRVKISNNEDMDLNLIKSYEDDSYFYNLYVYSFN